VNDILAIAVAHHQAGRFPQAEMLYREILQLTPNHADALHLLGLAIYQRGAAQEAVPYITAAIQIASDRAAYHSNLGRVYHALGQREQEIAAYRRALELDPAFAPAYLHMSMVLDEAGQTDEAIACLRRALQIKPDYALAHFNLGLLYQQRDALDEAVAEYLEAVRYHPHMASAHFNRGNALRQQDKLQQSAAAYEEALALEPERPDVRLNLAQVLGELGQVDRSRELLLGLLDTHPELATTHDAVAMMHVGCGDAEAARHEYLEALRLKPDWAAAHSRALACEQYLTGVSEASLAASHAEWDQRHGQPLRSEWQPHANSRDPDRRLRWGLVTVEFGDSPVGRLLIRALEALDPRQCEVFCYAEHTPAAERGERFRRAAAEWRDTAKLSDERLARQIRDDQIDVLFDLSGHSAANRLLVFARKPAPIQIEWIEYPGTTGIEAMDYLLADAHQVPPGSEPHYRERVLRVSERYVCFDPPASSPPVGPVPSVAQGYVTFGSFNNPLKFSGTTADLWAAILRRLPTSKLLLKYFNLEQPLCQRRTVELFAARGIGRDRLLLEGATPEFLADYGRVDVALDPQPFSGALTTCDALWMGVPVVAHCGTTFAGRQAAGYLNTLGLDELVTHDASQYVEQAVALATDAQRRAALRVELRPRMRASPLCDGKRLAADLQRLVRSAWREWVRTPHNVA
jgi:predicted O-linked N-acetylglucosamine transferase (SPINDLY family)